MQKVKNSAKHKIENMSQFIKVKFHKKDSKFNPETSKAYNAKE